MATKEPMNVRGIAQVLGVDEGTVRNWEARGLLRRVRLLRGGFQSITSDDIERLRAEMLERLAPVTEERIVHLGRTRRGRLVFGDADD
jgi:hypothetical protein